MKVGGGRRQKTGREEEKGRSRRQEMAEGGKR